MGTHKLKNPTEPLLYISFETPSEFSCKKMAIFHQGLADDQSASTSNEVERAPIIKQAVFFWISE